MVVCNVEIPRPPPPPPPLFNWGLPSLVPLVPLIPPKIETSSIRSKKSTNSQSFRLNDKDETGSIYSVYKQKIDSMFESDSSSTKNSVQARIEKMFTDVAKDGDVEIKDNGSHSFSVDYMGSVPLLHKVGSLSGLQDPLKELYFAYKRNFKDVTSLTGRLEISPTGLKIQYRGDKGDLEQLNSFPTIAVWSAVKFVLHDENGKTSYAFLPLITDPDNIDKQTLFKTLNIGDKMHVNSESHSPLFAVVMRKTGIQKQLECHGFICQTSEDAIVIAATLYKSLMAHMKSKDKKPKNKNGVTCMSVASSIAYEGSNSLIPIRPPRKKRSSSSSASEKDPFESTEAIPLIPNHSQLLKKSVKAKKAPNVPPKKLDLDAIVKCDEVNLNAEAIKIEAPKEIKPASLTNKWNTLMSNQQKKITAEIKQVISEGSHRGLQKTPNYVSTTDETYLNKLMPEISGDILTKVTIPRSGSFLNAGGLTRYKSKVTRANGQQAGGSPLGFNELFNEFRLQEGLHSVDEILGVIIDPEGMSFNDLKPIYKEFLLKLAVTLTKDELYQRSKAIMRRQRKKLIRRTSNIHSNKGNIIVNKKFKSLKHIFQKSLKMKLGKKIVKPQRQKLDITRKPSSKIADSSISTSSYDTRQFRPKTQLSQSSRKQNYRKRSGEFKTLSVRERMSTSEESDFFSVRRGKARGQYQVNGNQNKNSSSGYVSCSECSYDSDTCTCVSADKCYCSLGQKTKKHKGKCKSFPKRALTPKCYCNCQQDNYSYCGCDTDSCADSNKCYCPNGETTTILDQLKRRGFIPSIELVNDSIRHRKLCKSNSNTKSTKSLEYMHNPSEEYYERVRLKELQAKRNSYNTRARRSYSSDNLAVDYELFSVAKRHLQSRPSFGTPYLSKQASVRSYNSSRHGGRHQGKTLRSTSVSAGACTEALSVKKSAEIAALFADIKLSQTTDITHLIPPDYENDKKGIKQNKTKLDKNSSKIDLKYSIPNKNLINMSKSIGQNSMYSARNGLYTIQSQSDDSRRSSICEPSRQKRKDFFNFESQFDEKRVSTNIEDSLGYLP